MAAPKKFPDWLRQTIRSEVAEATKATAPSKPTRAPHKPKKPAARAARPTPVSPGPPGSGGPGVRVSVAPVPEPMGGFFAAPPKALDTDAHDVPESPCVVCGGAATEPSDYWGPWRRHRGCEAVHADPVARVQAACRALGLAELTRQDAALLPVTVPCFDSTHPEPTWTGEPLKSRLPWRHLNRADLAKAVGSLPELRADAGLEPTECTAGRCAWCGVVEAVGWVDAGHTWANGDPAPLCGDCHAVFVRHSEPAFVDDLRPALAEAITGVPPMIGEQVPDGLVPYRDTVTAPADADAEPGFRWVHLNPQAVESYRWEQWGRWQGRYAPPEHRAEAVRRAQQSELTRAEQTATREREEAERTNQHGF